MTTITLIHYRPDATDMCRGCEMGRACSEHDITIHYSIEDAATELARRIAENKTTHYLPGNWETTILVDGYTEYLAPDAYCDDGVNIWDSVQAIAIPIAERLVAEIEEDRRVQTEIKRKNAKRGELDRALAEVARLSKELS